MSVDAKTKRQLRIGAILVCLYCLMELALPAILNWQADAKYAQMNQKRERFASLNNRLSQGDTMSEEDRSAYNDLKVEFDNAPIFGSMLEQNQLIANARRTGQAVIVLYALGCLVGAGRKPTPTP